MATIEQVESWITLSGVQHVVRCTDGMWTHTLCDTLTTGAPDEMTPKKRRVCRKCRDRLPRAKKVEETT